MKYIIQDREAGNFIDEFDTIEEAERQLHIYESDDKRQGLYIPNFYEIIKAD